MGDLNKSSGLNLIVVEDSADLCCGWEDILSLDGHQVRTYLNAFEFFKHLEELEKCDLIISDFFLPDLNALQIIDEIRKIRPQIPFIVITGSNDPKIKNSVEKIDHCLLLHKPLGIEELEEGMKKLHLIA